MALDLFDEPIYLIRENWVPLDILHLLVQLVADPLSRMKEVLRS